ncbi:MAG TPA: type II secretion system protein GspG [Telluria sp.]|nr:type II secretion system protein GspG [Telluria sp.]
MAKKLTAALLALAALALAAFWYWSPYWSLYQMRAAARDQDAQAFNAYVDYSLLRDSLKRQLDAALDAQVANVRTASQAPLVAGLAEAAGHAVAGRMVDELVRPESVMRAMRHGRLKPRARLSEEQERARSEAQNDIDTITLALRLYKLDHGAYPTQKQGLRALVKKSAPREDGTREPYLDALPKDPWGRAYRYSNPGKDGEQVSVFYDPPPDEQADGEQRFAVEREGTGKMVVRMTTPTGEPNLRAPALVFQRSGFASWKLVDLQLPPRMRRE